jgi:raffinose/stachyose/melibiose transport system permease protein
MDDQRSTFLTSIGASLLGVLLLLPALATSVLLRLLPAVQTVQNSFLDVNLLRDSSDSVGAANYQALFQDRSFSAVMQYSLLVVIVRVAVVAVLPLLVGLLMGMQGKTGRVLNQIGLGLLLGISAPLAFIILFGATSRTIPGQDPFLFSLNLITPEGARLGTLLLDALLTAAIALPIGGLLYGAVNRGSGSPVGKAFVIWFGGVLLAAGSGFLSFVVPFILTNGGPGNSTVTAMLYNYNLNFRMMDLGEGAAISVMFIIGSVILAFIFWLLIVFARLRLQFLPVKNEGTNVLLLVTLPLIVLALLPFVLLYLWAPGQLTGEGADLAQMNMAQASANSLSTATVGTLLQLGIALLAGIGLGYLRPFGRIGSALLLFMLLLTSCFPDEALGMAWFLQARELGVIDTTTGLLNGFSAPHALLLGFMVLVFAGLREDFLVEERSAGHVVGYGLGAAVLAGLVLAFLNLHSLYWPLLIGVREAITLPVALIQVNSNFVTDFDALFLAVQPLVFISGFFGVMFALLFIFVGDKVALAAGGSSS